MTPDKGCFILRKTLQENMLIAGSDESAFPGPGGRMGRRPPGLYSSIFKKSSSVRIGIPSSPALLFFEDLESGSLLIR